MHSSCIHIMYIQNCIYKLRVYLKHIKYICCLSYKKGDEHHDAVVSQYHGSSEVVTSYVHICSLF